MDSMQPRQICGRPSGTQMRALLDELESQPHLAGGRTRGQDSRRRIDSLWRQISQRLNNLEGCTKSHKQWQKFWADKKSAVKKQVAARQAEGLSISTSVFSDIELRIVGLLEKTESTHDEDDSSKFVENIQFQPRIQCSRPSVEQVRALLDELEANPYLARGKLRRRSTPIWNSITSRLNVLEGCTKTAKQWMKYWSDKKVGVKRMLEAARVSSESNLQLDIQSTFSDEENRVIAILESSAFVDVQTDYNLQESPSMKEEYLENEDYLLDGTEPSFFDDFEESQAESTTTKVNLEKIIMKKSLRSNSVQKPKQNQMKCRSRPPWCPPSWRALLRMEERRIAAQESTAASLADIEACMRRQEEATRELARVLTRLLH